MSTERLDGLRVLASRFDDFLVDVWGVIHDGEKPFAGVVDALERLAKVGGKRVLFLTNTSRARDAVIETLTGQMKIDRGLFFDVVSSGDVTRAALEQWPEARCYHYGDPSFVPWLFETGLTMVDDLAGADLVVASGAPRDASALANVRALLEPAAKRDIPLVCSNPDRVIPKASGPGIGPGAVARAYAELGGRVFLYGKPHRPIYDVARRRLGADEGRRIVAIGDLLETDIAGAQAAGIANVLVTRDDQAITPADGPTPDMRLARFAW